MPHNNPDPVHLGVGGRGKEGEGGYPCYGQGEGGHPCPRWDRQGTPVLVWGTPSHSKKDPGTGVSSLSPCGQTNEVKMLPSLVLRTLVVTMHEIIHHEVFQKWTKMDNTLQCNFKIQRIIY